ncbi:MAG: S-methyl-5'-thioadenosine phosphorylase [Candidatus Methylacidiphilales bacterium]|nr:S-methyl-5'-thioadenosine phosphorylase [Candidatus Methylacidiphilales bacterium]
MPPIPIAVIGGSGVYHMEGLDGAEELRLITPFGEPSDAIRTGTLSGRKVAFLPRHGRNHHLLPSEIPHRANIWALKSLGVRWIISLSAVGSLKEHLKPRHFVLPHQFFDRTKTRDTHTFFGNGIAAHVSFGNPVCLRLATILYQAATTSGAVCHWGGTYVNMEGPAFSTRAESEFHRSHGFDVVGMTNLAEAKLAREAEISYATLAMVTDYDCWHGEEAEVSVADVVRILHDNATLAARTVALAVAQIPLQEQTAAHHALDAALITPRHAWPNQTAEALRPLLGRFLA